MTEAGATTTTFVRFHDRAVYFKMLEARLGELAPGQARGVGLRRCPLLVEHGISRAAAQIAAQRAALILLSSERILLGMTLRVPLIRVEGKSFTVRPDLTMTPQRFAAAAALEREARDEVARNAEVAFGFESSLYFFAGVAHPSFGDVVLAYNPELSTTLPGSVSTFDTGGMFLGLIQGNGLSTEDDRVAYVSTDCCALDAWRVRAARWIEDNFDSFDRYIDPGGRPRCDDQDDRLGHPHNERRAWAVEVRLYVDRDIFENLAFAVVRQDFLQRALQASQVSSADNERLLQLLADGKIIQVRRPTMHPSDLAVERIRTYMAAGSMSS